MEKYSHSIENIICIMVSNLFPRQSVGEYPKNWIAKRRPQKKERPSVIFLPSELYINALADVMQSNPIRKIDMAINNVCICIICLFTKLSKASSFFHEKYFGKIVCTNARVIHK